MNNQFTENLGKWLDTPADERDYTLGARYLLQLSGNKILYNSVMANLSKRRDVIEHQLRKYYNFRVQALTEAQVKEMDREVEKIVAERLPKKDETTKGSEADHPQRTGKREDHDALPEDIQALYVENLSLLRKIRELHMRLRSRTLTDSPCRASERYPFVKEIIALDKQMRSNWQKYDTYQLAPSHGIS